MTTAADAFEKTAHGSDGRFISGEGGKMSYEAPSKKQYPYERNVITEGRSADNGIHETVNHVKSVDDQHVGTVHSKYHWKNSGHGTPQINPKSIPDPEHTATPHSGEAKTFRGTGSMLAAYRHLADHHEKKVEKRMKTAADALIPKTAENLLGDLVKSDKIVGSSYSQRVAGSMEHFIVTVSPSLIAGCGCSGLPVLPGVYIDGGSHYPSVVATFADRGIVTCGSCEKNWEVPFTIEGTGDTEKVVTGAPVIVEQSYIKPEAVAADDNDGDEAEVVTD